MGKYPDGFWKDTLIIAFVVITMGALVVAAWAVTG